MQKSSQGQVPGSECSFFKQNCSGLQQMVARFYNSNGVLKTILNQQRHCIASLISVGKAYHEDENLMAVINLMTQLVVLEQELLPRKKWHIVIIVADSLQAYNHAKDEATLQAQQAIWTNGDGLLWRAEVEPLFLPLQNLGVTVEFCHWTEAVQEAKHTYSYDHYRKTLIDEYHRIGSDFRSIVISKGNGYHARKGAAYTQAELTKPLNAFQLEYIIEEIALLMGCMSIGLFFGEEVSKEVVLLYPSEEDRAFMMGRDLLVSSNSSKICWGGINLRTDTTKTHLAFRGYASLERCRDPVNSDNNRRLLRKIIYAQGQISPLQDLNNAIYSGSKEVNTRRITRNSYCKWLNLTLAEMNHLAILHGFGGVGKSSIIANHFDNPELPYKFRLWFDCKKESLFKQIVREALMQFGEASSNDKEIRKKLLDWLSNHSDWLLVFDNVEEYNVIKQFFICVKPGCHIVVSSREAPPEAYRECAKLVGLLLPEESANLIHEYLPDATAQQVQALVEKFDGYVQPLCLSLKNIANDPTETVENYLSELAKTPVPHQKELARVLNYSMNKIDPRKSRDQSISIARHILFFMTSLVNSDVHKTLIEAWYRQYFSIRPMQDLDDGLALIERYAMVTNNKEYYGMHIAVQSVLAEDAYESMKDNLFKWQYSIAAAFSDVFWDYFDEDLEVVINRYPRYTMHAEYFHQILKRQVNLTERKFTADEHVLLKSYLPQAVPEHDFLGCIEYKGKLASTYAQLGDMDTAKAYFIENLTLIKRKLNADSDIQTVRAAIKVAALGYFLKAMSDTELLLDMALGILLPLARDHHQELLRVLSGLAHFYISVGRHDDGLDMLVKALPQVNEISGGSVVVEKLVRYLIDQAGISGLAELNLAPLLELGVLNGTNVLEDIVNNLRPK